MSCCVENRNACKYNLQKTIDSIPVDSPDIKGGLQEIMKKLEEFEMIWYEDAPRRQQTMSSHWW